MTKINSRSLLDVYPHVYDFFKLGFYTYAIGTHKSILFERDNVWTERNLINVLENFDKKNIEKMKEAENTAEKELFWKRLKDQFKDVDAADKQDIYCLLADLMALHYVFTAGSGSKVLEDAVCNKLYMEVFGLNDSVVIDFSATDQWSRANGGMYYNQRRPHGMCYFAMLALDAIQNTTETASILKTLFEDENSEKIDTVSFDDRLDSISPERLIADNGKYTRAVKQMLSQRLPHHFALLHAARPDIFLPILSLSDINQIIHTFGSLVSDKNLLDGDSNVEKLKLVGDISSKLTEISNYGILDKQRGIDNFGLGGNHIAFYDPKIKPLWHDGSKSNEDKVGLSAALKIKKQIILYGPPGTGKTYAAKELSQSFMFASELERHGLKKTLEMRSDKNAWEGLITDRSTEIQIHPNMGYEDFIGGLSLDSENGGTVSKYKKGLFWEAMDRACELESGLPYFVILDEINRTDLSRMMGECLSRLEYRSSAISVPNAPQSGNKFVIPENVYIIGTMNEIDHSLERIDFAMRRRFIWIESNFDPEALREILASNTEGGDTQRAEFDTPEESVEDLTIRAIKLNNAIEQQTTLGKKYQVGHSYFLDINNRNLCKVNKNGKITHTAYKNGLKLLWEFSIKPILESYEPGENSGYMTTFESAFLG